MPPRPNFRERVARQLGGGGFQLPQMSSGIGIAPIQGAANLIGLGRIFGSIHQSQMMMFDRVRALQFHQDRFRGFLTLDESRRGDRMGAIGLGAGGERGALLNLLGGRLGGAGVSQQDIFSQFGLRDPRVRRALGLSIPDDEILGGARADTLIQRLGFAPDDIARLAVGAAGSGLAGTGGDFRRLGLLTGAVERAYNISAEAQQQLLGAYGRGGGGMMVDGETRAQTAASQIRTIISTALAQEGAGLSAAKAEEYLQEIAMLTRSQERQGITINPTTITSLGQTFRLNARDDREAFAGFRGLEATQNLISTARGLVEGRGSGFDQSVLLAEAARQGGDLFTQLQRLEEGVGLNDALSGILGRVQGMAQSPGQKNALALALRNSGGIFGGMGLRQIRSLLDGRRGEAGEIDILTPEEIVQRGAEVTGVTQRMTSGIARADVISFAGQGVANRLTIMQLEASISRSLRGAIESLERGSVEYVSAAFDNIQRLGNVSDIFAAETNTTMGKARAAMKAIEAVLDIITDSFSGESTPTAVERRATSIMRRRRGR